ncbi:phage integrase SAM-like domain-containing protein [Flavobacterium sp. NRK1]|uniref:tyrosine-type recombinase/integrase n=1 Tax=Flavobacterium sp. NRK1 TaxID=2954929 RepID=UPI002093256C|nr:phage integrase SAM-like domain-containing protein [Flavobacterium sp. NRK1]MCO6149095.1 site-specific integrase [Flavobacterium sp. NRK1]
MTVNLKLLTGEKDTAEGYPLSFVISHQGKKKKYQVGRCKKEHFIADEGIISRRHPDYDILYPIISKIKIAADKLVKSRETDIEKVYRLLFKQQSSVETFKEFCDGLIASMESAAEKFEKAKDYVNANKKRGNIRVYKEGLSQLENFRSGVRLADIDYRLLMEFRDHKFAIGNKKSTVSHYLRTLRALYNKAVKTYGMDDKKPFEGVFKGLTVRGSQTRKKIAGADTVRQIENLVHDYESMHRWTDLWLLQFYLGGADLINVYYLKHSDIKNGRVYFNRVKGNSATMVDLKLHPKAQAIIDKYAEPGEYLFPWRKDNEGYKTFRRAMGRKLVLIQKRHGIALEGAGGNLGIKMARHTFGNIAKQLFIEEDLLRELMGHERDGVDTYYKDRYPEAVRDAALFKVIG